MRVAFDTSVIVAGSIAGHVHEPRAAVWLEAVRESRVTACTTTHALAETWATATSLPVEPQIAPVLVERLIERFREHIEIVDLTENDYHRAMRRCGERSLRSGAIYDALHLVAAERWEADIFLTFNVGDFTRLTLAGGPRITLPPDPPEVDGVLEGTA